MPNAPHTPPPTPFAPPEQPPLTARGVTLGVSFLATVLLLAGLAVVPSPYVVRSPGPTEDTLGSSQDQPLIEISGAETYPSTGELRMVTVGVGGGPGYPVNVAQVAAGWIDGTRAVYPVEEVFPPDAVKEEVDALNAADMLSSQENATYAALDELGYEIPVVLSVAAAVEGSNAVGEVEEGDILTTLDGSPITAYEDLLEALDSIDAGTEVTLGLERSGETVAASFRTTANPESQTGSRLGVYIDPEFDFPIEVSIQIEDIGGPSAGMMFALGIIDKLTPEDETGGEVIAGTGTMDTTGEVGSIGGIQQKMHGAVRDGAGWFFAPVENCNEVYGQVPDGLRVVKVATLADARAAMVAIGEGTGDALPSCSAEDAQAAGR